MKSDVFGSLFCLVHETGAKLYPVRIKNLDTGKVAFRISKTGNTKDCCEEVYDENLVFSRVINEGWAVRASSYDRKVNGLYKISRRSIVSYTALEKTHTEPGMLS